MPSLAVLETIFICNSNNITSKKILFLRLVSSYFYEKTLTNNNLVTKKCFTRQWNRVRAPLKDCETEKGTKKHGNLKYVNFVFELWEMLIVDGILWIKITHHFLSEQYIVIEKVNVAKYRDLVES